MREIVDTRDVLLTSTAQLVATQSGDKHLGRHCQHHSSSHWLSKNNRESVDCWQPSFLEAPDMFQKDPGLLSLTCRLWCHWCCVVVIGGLPTISLADGHSPSTPVEKAKEIFDCWCNVPYLLLLALWMSLRRHCWLWRLWPPTDDETSLTQLAGPLTPMEMIPVNPHQIAP